MGNMDELNYRDEQVSDSIYEAAADAVAQCGYDQFEEVLLDYAILDIRWVSIDSVKALYPECLEPPYLFSPDEVIRLDWLSWAVSKNFDHRYEKAIVTRSESIVVALPTLMAREVFTYGLGPEYNWLEWEEGSSAPVEPSAAALQSLSELITGDWCDDVREHAEGDESHLGSLHPSLRDAVAHVIEGKDDVQ